MLAVLYRLQLQEGMEGTFTRHWRELAHYLVTQGGAIGSCLHKGDEGWWLAYSRWPSREMKERSWPHEGSPQNLPEPLVQVVQQMQTCIAHKLEPLYFEVVEDLLLKR